MRGQLFAAAIPKYSKMYNELKCSKTIVKNGSTIHKQNTVVAKKQAVVFKQHREAVTSWLLQLAHLNELHIRFSRIDDAY